MPPLTGGVLQVIGAQGCTSGVVTPCGAWSLSQDLSNPASNTTGYFTPLGTRCDAASRAGTSTTPGCPLLSAVANITNTLPGFPVYTLEAISPLAYTLYAYTWAAGGRNPSYTGVIGFAAGAAPGFKNSNGVAMTLYTATQWSTSSVGGWPYVADFFGWAPQNPNVAATGLQWSLPPSSPPAPPPPPFPPVRPSSLPAVVYVTSFSHPDTRWRTAGVALSVVAALGVLAFFLTVCTRQEPTKKPPKTR